jgi:hypothetical protein
MLGIGSSRYLRFSIFAVNTCAHTQRAREAHDGEEQGSHPYETHCLGVWLSHVMHTVEQVECPPDSLLPLQYRQSCPGGVLFPKKARP